MVLGKWLAFMCIFTYIYHSNKKAREEIHFPKLLILVNVMFGILYLPVRIVYAGFELLHNRYKQAWQYKDTSVWLVILTLMVFPLYIPIFFMVHLPVRLFTVGYKYLAGIDLLEEKSNGKNIPIKLSNKYDRETPKRSNNVFVKKHQINNTNMVDNYEMNKNKNDADIILKKFDVAINEEFNNKLQIDDRIELQKKQKLFIYENSKRYTQLSKVVEVINKNKVPIPFVITKEHPFSTRRDYDSEKSRRDVLHGYLVNNSSQVKTTLRKVQRNVHLKNTLHKAYGKIQTLPQLDNYEREESLIVKELFNGNVIETNFILTIKFSYTSPKGQSRHRTKEEYTAYELVKELKNIKETIDDRTEFEIFRDAERAKVTPGVRYDILKRDNFMCQICGATAEHGVLLHVDHIVPVAKWGKSEESNLQTLCSDCNLGKGTKD